MGGLILAAIGGTALWATLHDKKANLPQGQIHVNANKPEAMLVPFYPIGPTPALQKLQWLADEARCRVSDNAALMAGCIRERIAKVRAKALAYKERYEALRDLDRVYFENLNQQGLVPLTTHVPRYGPCDPWKSGVAVISTAPCLPNTPE